MTMKGSRYRYMQIEEKRGKLKKGSHGTTIKTYELRRWKKGTQGSIIELRI